MQLAMTMYMVSTTLQVRWTALAGYVLVVPLRGPVQAHPLATQLDQQPASIPLLLQPVK